MSKVTSSLLTVRRMAFTSPRSWEEVIESLYKATGYKINDPLPWMPQGETREALEKSSMTRDGPFGLMLLGELRSSNIFNHFLPENQFQSRVSQFRIGNINLGAKLYAHTRRTPLMAPPVVIVIELQDKKGVEIVYDVPSTTIGCESEEARKVAEEEIDPKFEALVLSIL